MNKRYRLNHSIENTSIFWFFSAAYRYFVHQTRANALKQGSQSIAMLEKLQKCSYRLLWKIEIVPFVYLNVVDKYTDFIFPALKKLRLF